MDLPLPVPPWWSEISKKTVIAQTPIAVISDLPTLIHAPQPMIAAGFGDILGKAIALADWGLGHLVWDEPYSSQNCPARAPDIWQSLRIRQWQ